jgi:hypothetical protein
MQSAIKKALRKRIRSNEPSDNQDKVEQKLAKIKMGEDSQAEIELKEEESGDGTASEKSLLKERKQAEQELEELFGECGTSEPA